MAPLPLPPALSPAELAFVRAALAQSPPIRLDVTKGPRHFRAMRAECDVLPTANGSARIAVDDGTEALVGVKAEVECTPQPARLGEQTAPATAETTHPHHAWLDLSVDVPGFRPDDALPVFLASMLAESLLADGALPARLAINRRFHWKLCVDILLLSPPLSYPLALLSMAAHLALRATRLPALVSEQEEDPLFNDDWNAAVPLYPHAAPKPPVIVLAMAVADNVIFDPAKEELAVADAVLAIACTSSSSTGARIVSMRTIDPPSHLTPPGVPNAMNSATGGTAPASMADALTQREVSTHAGVWTPPRGGMKRTLVARVAKMVVESGGVAEEVIGALAAIEVG